MATNSRNYLDWVHEAIDHISPAYYKLKTTYSSAGIIRERIFCYELYHQMRLIQTKHDLGGLVLNGEIDKRGHDNFARIDQKNPDFVFHLPGSMAENAIVIEVKGTIANGTDGIKKDLDTLTSFVKNYNYQIGVLIVFNHSLRELAEKCSPAFEEFKEIEKEIKERIFILCKKENKPIEQRSFLDWKY